MHRLRNTHYSMGTAYRLKASPDNRLFQFTSAGLAGTIRERIEFQDVEELFEGLPVFNLAFGDVAADGRIDDAVDSNNGDIVRVMGTVMAAVYEFTSEYLDCFIYFRGSNGQRTTFYQTILNRRYEELIRDFIVIGVTHNTDADLAEVFERGKSYDAFLVRRRLKNG